MRRKQLFALAMAGVISVSMAPAGVFAEEGTVLEVEASEEIPYEEPAIEEPQSEPVVQEEIPAEPEPAAPEVIPEETIPEETVPEETVPEETVPEETIPEEPVPESGTVTSFFVCISSLRPVLISSMISIKYGSRCPMISRDNAR